MKRTAGAALLLGAAGLLILGLERARPLRARTQSEPKRTARNLVLGALSMGVVAGLQRPIVDPLSAEVERRRWGLAQQLPAPAWVRDAAAFLLLDYTIYLWHLLTHKVPFLWRFHLVHHSDGDLDASTALRFHAADMALSIPWRAAQVLVTGASPRALNAWQSFFFASVLLHHSNIRIDKALEDRLVRLLTTPRLHGIHHDATMANTDANWSSGLSIWDWLHGTARWDVPDRAIAIGAPGHEDLKAISLERLTRLPFTGA